MKNCVFLDPNSQRNNEETFYFIGCFWSVETHGFPGCGNNQAQHISRHGNPNIHCLSAQEIPHELYVSGTRKCQLNHRISVCCKHYVFYVKKLKLHLNFLFRVSTALKYPQIQISQGIHSSRQYLEQ